MNKIRKVFENSMTYHQLREYLILAQVCIILMGSCVNLFGGAGLADFRILNL